MFFKSMGKIALLFLLIGSIYGCERVVVPNILNTKAITLAQVKTKHKLIAQNEKGTDFSGLPVLVSSRFVIMLDKREEFIKLINDAIPKVRMESGNISYSLYEEINNPNSFLIFEEWKSRKSLNKFIATDINQKKEQKIKEISVDQPSFKVYHFQSIDFKL